MTLEEAIKHCEDVADYDCFTDEQRKCSEEHRQLADWLRELKERREKEVTGDLISRQTALSAIEANQGTLNKRRVMKILEGLPSAEKAQLSEEDATFDCISRQAAIDAFWKLDVELRPSAMDAVVDMLKSLPTAEPNRASCKQVTGKLDLIDRQDAIDAIMSEPPDAHYPSWYADILKELPSASTDLSTFSDKLWKIAYERGRKEGRKKGKWIDEKKDSISLLVWGECSICGYDSAIHYCFCPNCGSYNGGEEE